jgi:hexosaminidase
MSAVFALLLGAAVIPLPERMEAGNGAFVVKPGAVIVAGGPARAAGEYLAQVLAPATGFRLKVVERGPGRNVIRITLNSSWKDLGQEGYRLEASSQRVEIRAAAAAGAFYGVQTLRQLLPAAVYASTVQHGIEWTVPAAKIEDRPRLAWRGALIDVARHFMPKETILKFIDLLAMQKMNTLQLHLTDDQGWRVEIRKYPRLTQVGGMRKETRLGHERRSKEFDGKPHGGFYTQADIREMVEYGRSRHVTLVPEIEMPGHAQAALAAYPELGNTGQKLEVFTYWGVNRNVFNVDERTILFLQDVLGEVTEMFPGRFIHVGGDEVPLDQWKASAEAQARLKELGLKETVQLHGYFIRRMDEYLRGKGRRLVGWDEILEGGVDRSATVMSWRGSKGGIQAARQGHDVVMAPNTHTYFDYYQGKPEEEPLAIGGFVPLEKVYAFDPVPSELNVEEAKRIMGTQGQLWTEYIPTPSQLEYMAFPRLAALAEAAWRPAGTGDYAKFVERLRVQEERWKALGVRFRPQR